MSIRLERPISEVVNIIYYSTKVDEDIIYLKNHKIFKYIKVKDGFYLKNYGFLRRINKDDYPDHLFRNEVAYKKSKIELVYKDEEVRYITFESDQDAINYLNTLPKL